MRALTPLMLAPVVALALALLSPASRAQQACQAVAAAISEGRDAITSNPARTLTPQQAIASLQAEFHASPRLLQAVAELTRFSPSADFHRFGNSNLRAAVIRSGSAGCQFFTFFATAPDGTSDVVDPPPILRDRPEGVMMPCSGVGSIARIGTVGGEPAFVVESNADQDQEISVTPRREDSWQKSCSVAIRYSATFAVTGQYCRGMDCEKVGAYARSLAMKFDGDPKSLAVMPTTDPQLIGQTALPTFGQAKHGAPIPIFAEDSIALSVRFEDEAYVARLGHVAIGWRRYPDYLFALYRLAAGKLEPVAGVVISKTRDKPARVTVR